MTFAYVQRAAPAVTVPVFTAFHAAGKNPDQPAPFETPALKAVPTAPFTVLFIAFSKGLLTTQLDCFQVFTQLGQWKISYFISFPLFGAIGGLLIGIALPIAPATGLPNGKNQPLS
jgi:hypothetical protein